MRILDASEVIEVKEKLSHSIAKRGWEPQVHNMDCPVPALAGEVHAASKAGAPYDLVLLNESNARACKEAKALCGKGAPHFLVVSVNSKNIGAANDLMRYSHADSVVLFESEDPMLASHLSQLVGLIMEQKGLTQ